MPEAVCPAELGRALLSEDDPSSPSSTPGPQESAAAAPGTPLPRLIGWENAYRAVNSFTQKTKCDDLISIVDLP